MLSIVVTLAVLNLPRSSVVKRLQPLNMLAMLVTSVVVKLATFTEVRAEQP